MNEFMLAAAALLVLLAPCIWVCLRGDFASASVSLQLASTIGALALLLISKGEGRQPFGDLAIVLAATSLVGGLLLARYLGESR
jgi:hypothetical protein